jgi:acyl-CoA synthetase (AMP-forming)/AMP-acid ligase II
MPSTLSHDLLSLVRGVPLAQEPGLGSLTIPGYLQEVVQRYAASEAVVMQLPTGERCAWTYDELWQRSVAVAKALVAAGVGKGSRVALLLTNRPEFIASLFGIALAGGIAAPLSTFSTAPELAHLLQASEACILLYERRVLKTDFGAMLCELEPLLRTSDLLESPRFPYLRQLVALAPVTHGDGAASDTRAVIDWSEFLLRGKSVASTLIEARAAQVKPADLGGVFFSSGTTSTPKGILHTQRAFAIQWWRWPRVLSIKEPARSWTGNGFFWSANISMILGTAFSTGGAVVLQPTFEPEATLKLLAAEQVSLMSGRPHQWTRLQSSASWLSADLSSVRYVTRGELIRQHPSVQSTWERPNSFGTTETMTILSAFTADTPVEQRAGSFGAALPGNTLKIVDPQTGETVSRRQRGEICVKGPTLMLGYCDKTPEETFDEEGFYHTGDGGYLDEVGRLYWQGRLSYMIKTGGANVSPEEVDAAIASLPGVKHTQTVGVPHETLSEMVVACIVPVAGVTLKEDEVVAHLKKLLASFKIPRKVLFFDDAEMTLTGNDKVKVDGLRQLAAKRLGVAYADT